MPRPVIKCQYCGSNITKRIIRGTDTIWNDPTGTRACPDNGDGGEHAPAETSA